MSVELLECLVSGDLLGEAGTRGDVVGTELGLPGEGRLRLTLALPEHFVI